MKAQPAMNCSDCGGPLRFDPDKDYLICDFCQNLVFPEPGEDGLRVFLDEVDERCPVCAVALGHAGLEDKNFLYCRRCRGMLLDMDVFGSLVARLRARRSGPPLPPQPADLSDLLRVLHCPRCHRKMDTHPYAGPGNIVIDNCPACRLNWLDHHELLRVSEAPGGPSDPDGWLAP